MKKLLAMSLFVFTVGLCTSVQAQVDVNPLNVARAFAMKIPVSFEGYLSCEMLIGNSFVRKEMTFTMGVDFGITKLVVDGTNNISLPEPIKGLPLGDGGLMRNVYLNINAMTKSGEYAGNGYTQRQVVSKGESLMVVLSPAEIRQEIPVDVEMFGNDIQLDIEGFTYGYGYGVSDGKFYVFLPPIGGVYAYTLRRRSDGSIIGSGFLEPFKPTVTANDAYVSFSYIGNVVGANFTQPNGIDDWASINDITLDCEIPLNDGSVAMGKVIFADVGSGNLELNISGEFCVYVQSAISDEGDMPFLTLEDHSSSDQGWYYTRMNTVGMNVGKVVITIIPKPTNTRTNPWMSFRKFYGSPSSVITIGGKG